MLSKGAGQSWECSYHCGASSTAHMSGSSAYICIFYIEISNFCSALKGPDQLSWLTVNQYPFHYIALCQPAATSDYELDLDDLTKVLKRPEHSTEAEHWVRCLEVKHIQDNKYRRGGARQYHWHVPTISIDSSIKTLPQNMLLDFFDPTFFNGLQSHTQQLCADPETIAIPKNEESWFTHSIEERLCDEDFTEHYGTEVSPNMNLLRQMRPTCQWKLLISRLYNDFRLITYLFTT